MIIDRRQLLGGMGASGLLLMGGRPLAALADAATAPPFTTIDIQADSHTALGRQLGEALRDSIAAVMEAEDRTLQRCRQALEGPLAPQVQASYAAALQAFPDLIKELAGLSEGCGVPFMELFAWNCRSEIAVLTHAAGCSTVGIVRPEGFILAHNEDGAAGYQGKMAVVRVQPPSGVGFAALAYPGTLPGLGPVVNARGVFQTTNYISPASIAAGVPRFFVGRAVCEARDLEHAITLATTQGRAFPWHHNLGDLQQGGRLVSLETWPDGTHDLQEITGLHLHTNHLTHSAMEAKPEDTTYLEKSSGPRMAALERLTANEAPDSREDLLALLADRSGSPTRLCRHAGDDFPGVTLATAVFTAGSPSMELLEAAPCFGRSVTVEP